MNFSNRRLDWTILSLTLVILVDIFQIQIQATVIPSQDTQDGSRIIGGSISVPYPWMVSIRGGNSTLKFHNCGGTLIDSWHIVTAAHCLTIINLIQMDIVLGAYKVRQPESTQQVVNISRIYIHNLYGNRTELDHDIAVILIWPQAKLNKYVQPFPNWNTTEIGRQNLTGENCVALGWGNQSPEVGNYSFPDELYRVLLTPIENDDCARRYPKGDKNEETWVYNGMLCVLGDNSTQLQGACSGDSGGPFICPTIRGKWKTVQDAEPEYFLAGVMSWVADIKPCGTRTHPTVFTRVENHLDFIRKAVSAHDQGSPNITNERYELTI